MRNEKGEDFQVSLDALEGHCRPDCFVFRKHLPLSGPEFLPKTLRPLRLLKKNPRAGRHR